MSIDFSIRPVGGPVATPVVSPQPDAAKHAVETELPPRKSTTAASAATRNSLQPETSNQIVIDRAAAEIVYRVVDTRTSVVVRQFPDEARLRARAYLRAQDEAKREQALTKLDQTA
jgi:hypothetical protein